MQKIMEFSLKLTLNYLITCVLKGLLGYGGRGGGLGGYGVLQRTASGFLLKPIYNNPELPVITFIRVGNLELTILR